MQVIRRPMTRRLFELMRFDWEAIRIGHDRQVRARSASGTCPGAMRGQVVRQLGDAGRERWSAPMDALKPLLSYVLVVLVLFRVGNGLT